MALADSKAAIGTVSELLQTQLTGATTATTVDIGRPEAAAGAGGRKFNLFLYQVDIDGHLRNQPLDEGQAAPIWVVLHYLMTAFDSGKESDSIAAHKLLSEGMLALHELNFIRPTSNALKDNPEPLTVTFDVTDSELLSKIMQGADEKYRVSMGFQVRPVMIAPGVEPSYALPVTSVGPPEEPGVVVIPSLGPRLDAIKPESFEAGDTITLSGGDIGTEIDEIRLGAAAFGVTAAKPGEIKATIAAATDLSPGSYPVTAVRGLPGAQTMASNAILGHLLPTLATAVPGALTNTAGMVRGPLTLTGHHLGKPTDSIFVAFYRNGSVARMLEATGAAAQNALAVTLDTEAAIPEGDYFIILRVNGEQAKKAIEVSWT